MTVYRFGPYRLDKERLLLAKGEQPVALGPKVVETLLALVERPGDVLTKTQLLERVWPEGFADEANLAQNIYVIRKALRGTWPREIIATVPRRGYRFTAPVCVEDERPVQPAVVRLHPLRRAGLAAAVLLAVLGVVAGIASTARSRAAAPHGGLSARGARLYAMGQYYWNQRTAPGIAKSLRYFGEVTRTDPRDARGYAGLAAAYAIEGDYGYGPLRPAVAFERARADANRALALNPDDAQAHAVLGLADDQHHEKAAATLEYRRAIALNPRDASAHLWYGALLLREGDGAAALAQLRRAAQLDPVSVATADWLSEAAYFGRRYRDAIAYAREALDLSPRRTDVYIPMGLAYEALGRYPAAIAAYSTYGRSCRQCSAEAAALLAHAYAASGEYSRARAELRLAQAGIASRSVDPEDLITALIAMGRKNAALRLLQHARGRSFDKLLALDPRMDSVRYDPRFRKYTRGPA